MRFKTMASLGGIFAFVFMLTMVLAVAVSAGPGGWCETELWDLYATCDLDGQCCIREEIAGECYYTGIAWECRCQGLYNGPIIWNPCECMLDCGTPE